MKEKEDGVLIYIGKGNYYKIAIAMPFIKETCISLNEIRVWAKKSQTQR